MKNQITVKVMLFSGLDKETQIKGYDPYKGIMIDMPKGSRLKTLVAKLEFRNRHGVAYYVNGKRAGMWQSLKDKDKIECIKPLSGG